MAGGDGESPEQCED
ncbi:hypothetical protein A2U01_0082836, partial [Trifolium medium]|nr:hypothetical protein [Trifolium medium]